MAIKIKTKKALNPNVGKARGSIGGRLGQVAGLAIGPCPSQCDCTDTGCGCTDTSCGCTDTGCTDSPDNKAGAIVNVANKFQKTFKVGGFSRKIINK